MSCDISIIYLATAQPDALAEFAAGVGALTTSPQVVELVVPGGAGIERACAQLAAGSVPCGIAYVPCGEDAGEVDLLNAGICAAHGRYLLFMRAGDALTPGSIDAIVTAFDEFAADADLLTFPCVRVNATTGAETRHKREKWLASTGIYKLRKCPYLCLDNLNVCVKRETAAASPFPQGLAVGATALFSTTALATKGTVVHCSTAELQQPETATDPSLAKPFYVFEDMLRAYQGLLGIAERHPNIQHYCTELVLADIGRRVSSNTLFPCFGSAEERERNDARLGDVLRAIPAKHVLQSKNMSGYVKLYLLDRYGLLPQQLRVEYADANALVYDGDKLFWKAQKPTVRIMRCVEHDAHMELMAFLECPAFYAEQRTPAAQVECAGTRTKVDLHSTSYTMKGAWQNTQRAWRIDCSIPVSRSAQAIEFHVAFEGEPVTSLRVNLQMSRANARPQEDGSWLFPTCTLSTQGNGVLVQPRKTGRLHSMLEERGMDRRGAGLRQRARAMRREHDGHGVWLYSDLPTSIIKGNALAQLLHDLPQRDGIVRYYVTSRTEELAQLHPQLEGHLLELGSEEHIVCYLAASAILASYLDTPTFVPCSRAEYNMVADLSRAKTMVYLQHGVLHAHMPHYCAYDRKLFDYEVVSTRFEQDNLARNYYFPPERLLSTGAPRMDDLPACCVHGRKIVYAPSWRGYLVGGNSAQREGLGGRFEDSAFCRGVRTFLNAMSSSGLLEEHDYTLELKLHPNFSVYKDLFEFDDPRISLAADDICPDEYVIMVTDYSSYLYDFLYAGSRIQYFLPDSDEFFGGVNHYSSLDLPFEEGFGPYSTDPNTAAAQLEELILQQEGRAPEDPLYEQRKQGFFLHTDGKNASRLYQQLRSICT